jgi:hypothetical protein
LLPELEPWSEPLDGGTLLPGCGEVLPEPGFELWSEPPLPGWGEPLVSRSRFIARLPPDEPGADLDIELPDCDSR